MVTGENPTNLQQARGRMPCPHTTHRLEVHVTHVVVSTRHWHWLLVFR